MFNGRPHSVALPAVRPWRHLLRFVPRHRPSRCSTATVDPAVNPGHTADQPRLSGRRHADLLRNDRLLQLLPGRSAVLHFVRQVRDEHYRYVTSKGPCNCKPSYLLPGYNSYDNFKCEQLAEGSYMKSERPGETDIPLIAISTSYATKAFASCPSGKF